MRIHKITMNGMLILVQENCTSENADNLSSLSITKDTHTPIYTLCTLSQYLF